MKTFNPNNLTRTLGLGLGLALLVLAQGRMEDINDEQIKPSSNLKGLSFVSRHFIPYGPDRNRNPPQTSEEQPYQGYAYGMVSLEYWLG